MTIPRSLRTPRLPPARLNKEPPPLRRLLLQILHFAHIRRKVLLKARAVNHQLAYQAHQLVDALNGRTHELNTLADFIGGRLRFHHRRAAVLGRETALFDDRTAFLFNLRNRRGRFGGGLHAERFHLVARRTRQLGEQIAAAARVLVQAAVDRGTCEFSADVAEHIPLAAICDLMQIPEPDRRPLLGHARATLAADTVVWSATTAEPLGKPRDREHARQGLRQLVGADHFVTTAWALARPGHAPDLHHETTRVWMRPLPDDELERYLDTDEWRDKAGGYGIQGHAAGLVTRVEGSYTNVVGLPLAQVLAALAGAGT